MAFHQLLFQYILLCKITSNDQNQNHRPKFPLNVCPLCSVLWSYQIVRECLYFFCKNIYCGLPIPANIVSCVMSKFTKPFYS